jgi:ribosome-associated protein
MTSTAKKTPTAHAPESLTGLEILERAAVAAADKKAAGMRLLDLRGTSSYTDYFLICSGNTDRQTKAIHDSVHEALKDDFRLLPRRVEGLPEARWILMDYFDVIVHIFVPEVRDFYRLEELWSDAPELPLPPDAVVDPVR